MNPVKRIALILFIIFLMPVLFFSVYEINSLQDDEKAINEIYRNQLDAILFSANQYADDITNSWLSKIELSSERFEFDSLKQVRELLSLNNSIIFIGRYDTKTSILAARETENDSIDRVARLTQKLIEENPGLIDQLIAYKQNGFQKIQDLAMDQGSMIALLFITDSPTQENQLHFIIIDPELFIHEVLGPRLQVIARDQFILMATDSFHNEMVYSTRDSTELAPTLQADLWLLPHHKLGIAPAGNSLENAITDRTQDNLLLLLALDFILIIAVILTYRSVRKEVRLANTKSEFISNVSHELRTPLALVNMFAETLTMGRVKTEEKKLEYYAIIHKETQRLTNIVNKILSFSQLDAGKKELKLEQVNLSQICHEVLYSYDYRLKEEQFKVQTKIDADVIISGDRDSIEELIINLIDNAIKYSEKVKSLFITLKSANHEAILMVKDSGIGISREDSKHIFDKFYRVPTGNLAGKQGTGIGLAIVKKIVDAHDAEIVVKSEENKGTEFIIKFKSDGQNTDS